MSSTRILWSDLIPWLHADLPGCGNALKLQKIRDTLIDFCHETQAWRYQIDPISIEADIQDYDIDDVPNCAVVDAILEVRISNTETENKVEPGRLLKPVRDYLFTSNKETLRLTAVPKTAIEAAGDTKGLLVKVALRPHIESEGMDDEAFYRLWNDYRDILAFGAMAKLQGMPKKTWSNPQEAAENTRKYLDGRNKARIEVNRSSLNTPLVARAPRQWALK